MATPVGLGWLIECDKPVYEVSQYIFSAENVIEEVSASTDIPAISVSKLLADAQDPFTADWIVRVRSVQKGSGISSDWSEELVIKVDAIAPPTNLRVRDIPGSGLPPLPEEFDLYVSPNGSDEDDGRTPETPLETIQLAIDRALPGWRIFLADGHYAQDFIVSADGIEIYGGEHAMVKGAGADRVCQIQGSDCILRGFSIDGLHGAGLSDNDYRDKLIYVMSPSKERPVKNLKLLNMKLLNSGGEALRLKYFVQDAEIAYCGFKNCGVHDFQFSAGGKNGEAVYIGTSPKQWDKNPTQEPDICERIHVHHCTFDTQGNESVDIKEFSRHCLIEYNDCAGGKDPEAGAISSRGDDNVIRYNKCHAQLGTGVRLGGHGGDEGIRNEVYGNDIWDCEHSALKVERAPQGKICGNNIDPGIENPIRGKFADQYDPSSPCVDGLPSEAPAP